MKNITLGKYVPYNSFVHRLDPRFKILAMIVLLVAVFLKFESVAMNFAMYLIFFIIIAIIMKIAHISFKSLFGQLKAMWMMLFFLLIINIMMPRTDSESFIIYAGLEINPGYSTLFNDWKIYYSSISNTLYIVFRLIIMFGLTLVLTSTTKPLEITSALEFLMAPLKVIKFPVHEIAMTISLALRFIPTLLEETDRIMKAQASRGVDFEHGKLKEKIRAIISLIIPLFISAFQRSEELANAMEARGYNPQAKRTRYRINKWSLRDTLASIFVVIVFAGSIVLCVLHVDFVAVLATYISTLL